MNRAASWGCILRRVSVVLLIVGGNDPVVRQLNEQAAKALGAPAEIAIAPGATHLFEEPGALDAVIHLATEWLNRWLAG